MCGISGTLKNHHSRGMSNSIIIHPQHNFYTKRVNSEEKLKNWMAMGLFFEINILKCNHNLFHWTLLYCASQILHFFTSWLFVATLCWANLSASFFSSNLFSLYICGSHFSNSWIISKFSLLLYLLQWSAIGDRWCYYYDSKAQTKGSMCSVIEYF